MKKKKETIHVMSGVEATVMPRYNAFSCGYGMHKSAKHPNRQKEKIRYERNYIHTYREENMEKF